MKKKKMFYEDKIRDTIGKPKELWKTINSLGLNSKQSNSKICSRKMGISVLTQKLMQVYLRFFLKISRKLIK